MYYLHCTVFHEFLQVFSSFCFIFRALTLELVKFTCFERALSSALCSVRRVGGIGRHLSGLCNSILIGAASRSFRSSVGRVDFIPTLTKQARTSLVHRAHSTLNSHQRHNLHPSHNNSSSNNNSSNNNYTSLHLHPPTS